MTAVFRRNTAPGSLHRGPGLVKRALAGFCVNLIRFYRVAFSPLFAGACRFQPSCSHYAEEAIRLHGPGRGIVLTDVDGNRFSVADYTRLDRSVLRTLETLL